MPETVYAKFGFTYNHTPLDPGEIYVLPGLERDEKMIGLRYFEKYDPKLHGSHKCDMCSRKFISEAFYVDHKRKEGGCMGEPKEITKAQTAELLDKDPKDVRVEE